MRVYEDTETVVTSHELVLVTCNKCGDEHNPEDGPITDLTLRFGYGSAHDTEHWAFDLCDTCLDNFVKGFKHAPSKL